MAPNQLFHHLLAGQRNKFGRNTGGTEIGKFLLLEKFEKVVVIHIPVTDDQTGVIIKRAAGQQRITLVAGKIHRTAKVEYKLQMIVYEDFIPAALTNLFHDNRYLFRRSLLGKQGIKRLCGSFRNIRMGVTHLAQGDFFCEGAGRQMAATLVGKEKLFVEWAAVRRIGGYPVSLQQSFQGYLVYRTLLRQGAVTEGYVFQQQCTATVGIGVKTLKEG